MLGLTPTWAIWSNSSILIQLTKSPLTCILHSHAIKCKIPRKFELQGHTRCQSKVHMQLPISHLETLVVYRTVFEISTHKARK